MFRYTVTTSDEATEKLLKFLAAEGKITLDKVDGYAGLDEKMFGHKINSDVKRSRRDKQFARRLDACDAFKEFYEEYGTGERNPKVINADDDPRYNGGEGAVIRDKKTGRDMSSFDDAVDEKLVLDALWSRETDERIKDAIPILLNGVTSYKELRSSVDVEPLDVEFPEPPVTGFTDYGDEITEDTTPEHGKLSDKFLVEPAKPPEPSVPTVSLNLDEGFAMGGRIFPDPDKDVRTTDG